MATFKEPVRTVDTTTGLVAATNSATSGAVTAVDRIRIIGAANAAAANVLTITNASLGQATTLTIPDVGAATGFVAVDLSSSVALAPGVIVRRVVASAANLATAGKQLIQSKTSATSQFEVLGMRVLKSTGLSGGSGDRLLALSDGTIVFNATGITAALAGTPITTRPAGTGNPDIATSVDPLSTAGADIYLQYTGGTLDYATGNIIVEVTLAQIAG